MAVLVLGLLIGFGLVWALIGQSVAGPPTAQPPAHLPPADAVRASCVEGTARVDVSEVQAQPDGVHVEAVTADTVGQLRFANDANYLLVFEANPHGPTVMPLAPGRWHAVCAEGGELRFAGSPTLDVVDPGGYWTAAEPECSGAKAGTIRATTHEAWAHPEDGIRRVAAVGRNDTVEPAGYTAAADDPDRYDSYLYRIVRDDYVVGRAKIFRGGLSIFGCIAERS
jgi:hypothetical protein